jgi:hypothetical protein
VSALVEAGSALTLNLTLAFTTAANLYVGGHCPGTLSVSRGGVTLADKGGVLVNAATLDQVGTVDYANGVLSLTSNVLARPAAPCGDLQACSHPGDRVPELQLEGHRGEPAPELRGHAGPFPRRPRCSSATCRAGTGTPSRRRQRRSARLGQQFGVGTINFSTGTLSATLGALPDVGSEVIVVWAPAVQAVKLSTCRPAAMPWTAGRSCLQHGPAHRPGSLTLTWAGKTATDDGAGGLTGDAVGEVIYATGVIRFRPTRCRTRSRR